MAVIKRCRKSKAKNPINNTNRPRKLRQWSETSLNKALELVALGKMGVNRAALECNVPPTTLKDRIAGRVAPGSKMGQKPYLTDDEEKELVKFVTDCAKMGYRKTRQDVMQIVEKYMVNKGREMRKGLSNGWWNCCIKWWPQLSLRKGDSFAVVCEHASNREVFESYFNLLDDALMKNGLKDKPSQIYNCNEPGMPLQHSTKAQRLFQPKE